MSYQKRISASRTWNIPRLSSKYVVSGKERGSSAFYSIPLLLLLKAGFEEDRLKTKKELKQKYSSKIFFLGKELKRLETRLCLFEQIEIDKKQYIVVFKNKKLHLLFLEQKRPDLFKLETVTLLKKKKIQLNFLFGKNLLHPILLKKGCSCLVENKKIIAIFEFIKGGRAYILKGKYLGQIKTVVEVDVKGNVLLEGGLKLTKNFLFLVDKDFDVIW